MPHVALCPYFCSYDKYGTDDDDGRGHFYTSSHSGSGRRMSEQDLYSFIFSNMFFFGRRGFGGFDRHDDYDDSTDFDFAGGRSES